MTSWLIGAVRAMLVLQSPGADVAGVVRDGASAEPLAGATVTLTELGRAVTSDSLGRYAFRDVPAGPRHLAIRRVGYSPRVLHALVPQRGVLAIDILLARAPTRLSRVVVRPTVPVRGIDGIDTVSHPGRTVSTAAMREHPLLAEPDALLALTGGEVSARPETPSGIHLRGGSADQTAYLLDGIPVFSPYHAAGTFGAWNPDALERVSIASDAARHHADALAGVVAATTRTPGRALSARGATSTAQSRLTIDGPLGRRGAGFLASARSTYPGAIRRSDEASYVAGHAGDVLAKVEAPVGGGQLRAIGFGVFNDLDAAATRDRLNPARNEFEWTSRSVGAAWERPVRSARLRVRGWKTKAAAKATWLPDSAEQLRLASQRRDAGAAVEVERARANATTVAGLRLEQARTDYRLRSGSADSLRLALPGRGSIGSAFARTHRKLGRTLSGEAGLSVTAAAGGAHLSPRAELRWAALPDLSLTATYDRSHQFAQSLKNPESIATVLFPAELWLRAGDGGLPVAHADEVVLAAELRPSSGARVGVQAHARSFTGVALVAPRAREPFVTSGFDIGSGVARGASIEGALAGARVGALASYGLEVVQLRYAGRQYTPAHAMRHVLEAGATMHPAPTLSLRAGLTYAAGRRSTGILGDLEWESCALVERGCEFGGSPAADAAHPGAARLPPYARLDLGARKHWHLHAGGRHATLALFGTFTNVFGRRNVQALVAPEGRLRQRLDMRGAAPLVIGLDWEL